MSHVSSPTLETDGVDAQSVECSKNDDGSLHCTVYTENNSFSGTRFEAVRSLGTESGTTHYGPQENPHVSLRFDEPTVCKDRSRNLVCK